MQTLSTAAARTIAEAQTIRALPRVIVEWNHNRYASRITAASATDSYTTSSFTVDPITDEERKDKVAEDPFPIASIIWANRPNSGLPKARVGEARTSSSGSTKSWRTVSPNAINKYWTSPNQSAGTTNASGWYPIVNSHASVVYEGVVRTNKIVVKTEASWAWPIHHRLQITNDGTIWTDIVVNSSMVNEGLFQVYLQADGSWSGAVNHSHSTYIKGVRFIPDAMSRGNAHFNLIEISARLEEDISPDVISVNVTKSMQERALGSPVGTISSNVCELTLDNSTFKYSTTNPSSPYAGILGENAEVRVSYGVDASAYGGGTMEYIPQGVFYVDSWGQAEGETVANVSCTDFAKFLQVQKMPARLYHDKPIPTILKEVLRSVGFNNFIIDETIEGQYVVPFVWFNGQDTVWTAISGLMKAIQCAVYFDEQGRLVYLSRTALFSKTIPDFALISANSGATLPNIETLEVADEEDVNKITISYTPANVNQKKVRTDRDIDNDDEAEYNESIRRLQVPNKYKYDTTPINSIVWQPEDTVALQAADLTRSLTANGTHMYIDEAKAQTFPFKGIVNIEGEIIRYGAKQYKWYKNGSAQYTLVSNAKQQLECDKQADNNTRNTSRYTGYLAYLRRGQMQTKAAAHNVDIQGWQHLLKNDNGTVVSGSQYVKHSSSELQLLAPNKNTYEQYLLSVRGSDITSFTGYGTRFRFANIQSAHQTCGLVFGLEADNKAGWYVEFNSTRQAFTTLKGSVANIRFYRMNSNGTRQAWPANPDAVKGFDFNIVTNQWVTCDVTVDTDGSVSIFVNGLLVGKSDIPVNQRAGKFGVWTRGHSGAAFEYFYANNSPTPYDINKSSYFNKIEGGFTSGYADREIVRNGKGQAEWFMDEFGPIVHEIREFDVIFDKFPVIHSYTYLTNTWDAFEMSTVATPFGAKVLIANAGRDTAILNGEDTGVVFGEAVNQRMMMFGQLVIREEEKQVLVKDENSIRRAGEIELAFDSPWIQTEAFAREIGEFFVDQWKGGKDVIQVATFFNPALQIGDLVSVNWPERHYIASTHKYHVVEISSSYNNGFTGTLTLRRA